MGRLAPGVSVESANTELATIAVRLGEEYPGENLIRGARLVPLQEALVGSLRQPFTLPGTLAYRRFLTQLLSFFGASALFLAALGLYGVLAYSMARRTREIGLRVAIGAQKLDVLGLVLGQGLKLTTLGIVFGLAGAWATTRWLQSILFGVQRGDPLTLGAVAGAILIVALLATWIPARRALGIEPTRALQEE